jgi:hypothetical protein
MTKGNVQRFAVAGAIVGLACACGSSGSSAQGADADMSGGLDSSNAAEGAAVQADGALGAGDDSGGASSADTGPTTANASDASSSSTGSDASGAYDTSDAKETGPSMEAGLGTTADASADQGVPSACVLAAGASLCAGQNCSNMQFWYDPLTGQCEGSCFCPTATGTGIFATNAQCRSTCVDSVSHATCASAGGQCSNTLLCPVNTEPVYPDPHRDCGPQPGMGGYCCVAAPSTPCSASGVANCALGAACSGEWGLPLNEACEPGRVCCRVNSSGNH